MSRGGVLEMVGSSEESNEAELDGEIWEDESGRRSGREGLCLGEKKRESVRE